MVVRIGETASLDAGAENYWKATDFLKKNHAYGVDPTRQQFYSLRQARYDAVARDIDDWAGAAARTGKVLRVLDVGCGPGVLLRYLEIEPHFAHILFSGADLTEHPCLYKRELFHEYFTGDLMTGYPNIPTDSQDVVICEQLLEHLPELAVAIGTLERILRPGGRLVVGVPIFPPPLDFIRKHLVPKMDRVLLPRKSRGHLQAFSLRSFLDQMHLHSSLRLLQVRGFRMISGGLLQPLEHFRWWWRLNQILGELFPGACIEVQAVMEKPPQSLQTHQPLGGAD
jgi:SAM-dependent methyltransferase